MFNIRYLVFVFTMLFFSYQGMAADSPNWKFKANFLTTGKAKIDEIGRKNERISYSFSEGEVSYTHHLDKENALSFDLGYSLTEVDWKNNPSFKETMFSYLKLSLGGSSTLINDWVWTGKIDASIDSKEMNFSHYALYNGTMWGRYSLSQIIGIHIGLTGTTGLKRDKCYPILGIDYVPNARWKIHVIFPLNLSAIYSINDHWSLSASGRTFRSRHRLSQKEIVSKGIFDYRTYGTELSLIFQLNNFSAKAYTGSTYSGDLKITDSKNLNPRFYNYKGVIYLGGNLSYYF